MIETSNVKRLPDLRLSHLDARNLNVGVHSIMAYICVLAFGVPDIVRGNETQLVFSIVASEIVRSRANPEETIPGSSFVSVKRPQRNVQPWPFRCQVQHNNPFYDRGISVWPK